MNAKAPPAEDLSLFDAHTHVVAADERAYPFTPRSLSGEWYRDSPCSADDFVDLLDESGVAGAVLVQPVGAYSYDNSYTADSAARFPTRFASACCIDAEAEDSVRALTYWVRERRMHGGPPLRAVESRALLARRPVHVRALGVRG